MYETVSSVEGTTGMQLIFDRVIYRPSEGFPAANELIVNTTSAQNCCIACQNTVSYIHLLVELACSRLILIHTSTGFLCRIHLRSIRVPMPHTIDSSPCSPTTNTPRQLLVNSSIQLDQPIDEWHVWLLPDLPIAQFYVHLCALSHGNIAIYAPLDGQFCT
jgi:hypothetical protein